MQLSTTTTPGKVGHHTSAKKRLVAGNAIKMEIGPEEELDVVVPAGEVWHAHVDLRIDVTDA